MPNVDANCFARPLIILSAPRSGSTLLFESIIGHPETVSVGGESHAIIEHIPELSTVARGYQSNQLSKNDATPEIITQLKQRFAERLVNFIGQTYVPSIKECVFVEKTPKNALRIPFLRQVFPNAKFVCLVRDPLANIASIMDAWQSGRFVTYPNLPEWGGHWSLLLPPMWQNMIGKPLAEVAAFQWTAANEAIAQHALKLADDQVLLINYADLVDHPAKVLDKIAQFAGLAANAFDVTGSGKLPLSRYTLAPPKVDKWRRHSLALQSVVELIRPVYERLNEQLLRFGGSPLLLPSAQELSEQPLPNIVAPHSRNADCPCGSGKRYKHCHGKMS